jgi:pimeloyl-ACP methyl ester carboxylesterase
MTFPLTLKKTEKPSTFNRPQTPQPPFDYEIEDITYYNNDSSIRYGATITLPKGKGPFPAILLISGSGQQNRDSELFGHKLFAVIADHLTKAGYIVLRVDDRGVGQTTGKLAAATTADFAQDAEYGINYLTKRAETDNGKIGLVGHSEGGMIAEMIAARRKDISFMILMAAPGVSNMQLLEDQNAALYEKAGLSNDKVEAYRKLYRNIVKVGVKAKDTAALYKDIAKVVAEWKKKTPGDVVLATTGISDEASERKFVQTFADAFAKPWYRYFAAYDPKSNLQKTTADILALNGDKDLQVIAASNIEGIRRALSKGKAKSYEVKILPGLNHLFQTCKTCTIAEYAQLEETISPVALKAMKDWLDKEVK